MIESGFRRIKRAILLDSTTLMFWDTARLEALAENEIFADFVAGLDTTETEPTTNLQYFIQYTKNYLKGRKEVRKRRYPFIVRVMEPTSEGLPLEIYVFVKVSNWEQFEAIQADIFVHLMTVLPHFDLKMFQV